MYLQLIINIKQYRSCATISPIIMALKIVYHRTTSVIVSQNRSPLRFTSEHTSWFMTLYISMQYMYYVLQLVYHTFAADTKSSKYFWFEISTSSTSLASVSATIYGHAHYIVITPSRFNQLQSHHSAVLYIIIFLLPLAPLWCCAQAHAHPHNPAGLLPVNLVYAG